MGLAVLVRSSPNVQPASTASPVMGPDQWMSGPEQTWPPTAVLPAATEASALAVPAFWQCHSYVCSTVGMLPVTVFRDTDALDPQPGIIRQPDPNQTPMSFWAGVVSALALYGNSVNLITSRDRYGYPQTVKPVHPTLTAVRFMGNPMAPSIAAWYIAGQIYDPTDVWHIRSHKGRTGWPLGRGLIDTTTDPVAMALALQSYAASFFNNSGVPLGILKIHRPEITQAQADDARSRWINKYSGANSVAVLNELTDFTPVAFRPIDSQMIESRGESRIDMANLWSMPPTKLGAPVAGGTYRNAEQEEVQARNDAIAPWTVLLEQAISIDLLPRGQRAAWDLAASLRTDTLSLYQAYQAALGGPGPQSSWLLVDEVRARQNLDPMAISEAEFAAEVKAAGIEVAQEVAATAPPVAGLPPPVEGGPESSQPFPAGGPETTNQGAPGSPGAVQPSTNGAAK